MSVKNVNIVLKIFILLSFSATLYFNFNYILSVLTNFNRTRTLNIAHTVVVADNLAILKIIYGFLWELEGWHVGLRNFY